MTFLGLLEDFQMPPRGFPEIYLRLSWEDFGDLLGDILGYLQVCFYWTIWTFCDFSGGSSGYLLLGALLLFFASTGDLLKFFGTFIGIIWGSTRTLL